MVLLGRERGGAGGGEGKTWTRFTMIWGYDFNGMWLLVLVIFLIPSEILIHNNSLVVKLDGPDLLEIIGLTLQLAPFGNYPQASVV